MALVLLLPGHAPKSSVSSLSHLQLDLAASWTALFLGESSAVDFREATLRLANLPWQRPKMPVLWVRDLTERQCWLLASMMDDV